MQKSTFEILFVSRTIAEKILEHLDYDDFVELAQSNYFIQSSILSYIQSDNVLVDRKTLEYRVVVMLRLEQFKHSFKRLLNRKIFFYHANCRAKFLLSKQRLSREYQLSNGFWDRLSSRELLKNCSYYDWLQLRSVRKTQCIHSSTRQEIIEMDYDVMHFLGMFNRPGLLSKFILPREFFLSKTKKLPPLCNSCTIFINQTISNEQIRCKKCHSREFLWYKTFVVLPIYNACQIRDRHFEPGIYCRCIFFESEKDLFQKSKRLKLS